MCFVTLLFFTAQLLHIVPPPKLPFSYPGLWITIYRRRTLPFLNTKYNLSNKCTLITFSQLTSKPVLPYPSSIFVLPKKYCIFVCLFKPCYTQTFPLWHSTHFSVQAWFGYSWNKIEFQKCFWNEHHFATVTTNEFDLKYMDDRCVFTISSLLRIMSGKFSQIRSLYGAYSQNLSKYK